MKKLFFTLIAVLTLTATTYAQDTKTAIAETKSELAKSKVSRQYTYILPSNVTAEQVNKYSKYYESYFTIKFDEDTHVAKVTMNSEVKKGEMVMGRFLSSCGVSKVKVGEDTLTLDEFMKKYLM